MKTERKFLNLILAAAAIFYLAFIFGTSFVIKGERYFTLVDDAMISMRYAQHLAQGHGLTWNIGEAPVEGFTNLGWTLYMGFLHLFPIPASKISLAVMLTSVGHPAGKYLYRLQNRRDTTPRLKICAHYLPRSSPHFIFHLSSGPCAAWKLDC